MDTLFDTHKVNTAEGFAPPREWFETPPEWLDTSWADGLVQIGDDGRVAALVAPYKECILDGTGTCFTAPESPTNYEYAHVGALKTAEGDVIRVANVGGGTGHFDPSQATAMSPAVEHYANTASRIMVGRYHDMPELGGIVFLGSMWPGTGVAEEILARASALSGDWRWVENLRSYDMAGSQLVNNPGFRPSSYEPRQFAVVASMAPGHLSPDVLRGAWELPEPDPRDELLDRVELIEQVLVALVTEYLDDTPDAEILEQRDIDDCMAVAAGMPELPDVEDADDDEVWEAWLEAAWEARDAETEEDDDAYYENAWWADEPVAHVGAGRRGRKKRSRRPNPKSSIKEIVGSHGHRPHGPSILWPAMYEHLRAKGMSKRKAAMISNGKWNRKHKVPSKQPSIRSIASLAPVAGAAGWVPPTWKPPRGRRSPEHTINGESPADFSGATIELVPVNPETLAVPGGDPAGSLHTTLKHLGDDATQWNPFERRKVENIVGAWAANCGGPIDAHISGTGPLGDEGALVRHLDCNHLHPMRAQLSELIDGITDPDTDDTYPEYNPHLTVGYGLNETDVPDAEGHPVRFAAARINWGDEYVEFPLGNPDTEPEATPIARTAAPRVLRRARRRARPRISKGTAAPGFHPDRHDYHDPTTGQFAPLGYVSPRILRKILSADKNDRIEAAWAIRSKLDRPEAREWLVAFDRANPADRGRIAGKIRNEVLGDRPSRPGNKPDGTADWKNLRRDQAAWDRASRELAQALIRKADNRAAIDGDEDAEVARKLTEDLNAPEAEWFDGGKYGYTLSRDDTLGWTLTRTDTDPGGEVDVVSDNELDDNLEVDDVARQLAEDAGWEDDVPWDAKVLRDPDPATRAVEQAIQRQAREPVSDDGSTPAYGDGVPTESLSVPPRAFMMGDQFTMGTEPGVTFTVVGAPEFRRGSGVQTPVRRSDRPGVEVRGLNGRKNYDIERPEKGTGVRLPNYDDPGWDVRRPRPDATDAVTDRLDRSASQPTATPGRWRKITNRDGSTEWGVIPEGDANPGDVVTVRSRDGRETTVTLGERTSSGAFRRAPERRTPTPEVVPETETRPTSREALDPIVWSDTTPREQKAMQIANNIVAGTRDPDVDGGNAAEEALAYDEGQFESEWTPFPRWADTYAQVLDGTHPDLNVREQAVFGEGLEAVREAAYVNIDELLGDRGDSDSGRGIRKTLRDAVDENLVDEESALSWLYGLPDGRGDRIAESALGRDAIATPEASRESLTGRDLELYDTLGNDGNRYRELLDRFGVTSYADADKETRDAIDVLAAENTYSASRERGQKFARTLPGRLNFTGSGSDNELLWYNALQALGGRDANPDLANRSRNQDAFDEWYRNEATLKQRDLLDAYAADEAAKLSSTPKSVEEAREAFKEEWQGELIDLFLARGERVGTSPVEAYEDATGRTVLRYEADGNQIFTLSTRDGRSVDWGQRTDIPGGMFALESAITGDDVRALRTRIDPDLLDPERAVTDRLDLAATRYDPGAFLRAPTPEVGQPVWVAYPGQDPFEATFVRRGAPGTWAVRTADGDRRNVLAKYAEYEGPDGVERRGIQADDLPLSLSRSRYDGTGYIDTTGRRPWEREALSADDIITSAAIENYGTPDGSVLTLYSDNPTPVIVAGIDRSNPDGWRLSVSPGVRSADGRFIPAAAPVEAIVEPGSMSDTDLGKYLTDLGRGWAGRGVGVDVDIDGDLFHNETRLDSYRLDIDTPVSDEVVGEALVDAFPPRVDIPTERIPEVDDVPVPDLPPRPAPLPEEGQALSREHLRQLARGANHRVRGKIADSGGVGQGFFDDEQYLFAPGEEVEIVYHDSKFAAVYKRHPYIGQPGVRHPEGRRRRYLVSWDKLAPADGDAGVAPDGRSRFASRDDIALALQEAPRRLRIRDDYLSAHGLFEHDEIDVFLDGRGKASFISPMNGRRYLVNLDRFDGFGGNPDGSPVDRSLVGRSGRFAGATFNSDGSIRATRADIAEYLEANGGTRVRVKDGYLWRAGLRRGDYVDIEMVNGRPTIVGKDGRRRYVNLDRFDAFAPPPGSERPGAPAPEALEPDVPTPATDLPDVDVPDVDVPDADTPEVNARQAEVDALLTEVKTDPATRDAFSIYAQMSGDGTFTAGELATATGVDTAETNRLLRKLESANLVSRVDNSAEPGRPDEFTLVGRDEVPESLRDRWSVFSAGSIGTDYADDTESTLARFDEVDLPDTATPDVDTPDTPTTTEGWRDRKAPFVTRINDGDTDAWGELADLLDEEADYWDGPGDDSDLASKRRRSAKAARKTAASFDTDDAESDVVEETPVVSTPEGDPIDFNNLDPVADIAQEGLKGVAEVFEDGLLVTDAVFTQFAEEALNHLKELVIPDAVENLNGLINDPDSSTDMIRDAQHKLGRILGFRQTLENAMRGDFASDSDWKTALLRMAIPNDLDGEAWDEVKAAAINYSQRELLDAARFRRRELDGPDRRATRDTLTESIAERTALAGSLNERADAIEQVLEEAGFDFGELTDGFRLDAASGTTARALLEGLDEDNTEALRLAWFRADQRRGRESGRYTGGYTILDDADYWNDPTPETTILDLSGLSRRDFRDVIRVRTGRAFTDDLRDWTRERLDEVFADERFARIGEVFGGVNVVQFDAGGPGTPNGTLGFSMQGSSIVGLDRAAIDAAVNEAREAVRPYLDGPNPPTFDDVDGPPVSRVSVMRWINSLGLSDAETGRLALALVQHPSHDRAATIRHEIGHQVDNRLAEAGIRQREFRAWQDQISNNPTILLELGIYSLSEFEGTGSFAEPWAEMFSVVTHPQFADREGYSPEAEEAFRLMQEVIDPMLAGGGEGGVIGGGSSAPGGGF